MWRASWILFTAHLRRTLLSRRALLCVLLALGPLLPAFVIRVYADEWDGLPTLGLTWILHVQLVVPLVALLLGSAVVAEEVEDRTVTYLFTRPIPRAALLAGRWAAAFVVALFLLGASAWAVTEILTGAAEANPLLALGGDARLRLLETIALGAAAYSLVFAAAGAFVKHPVIVGLGYTFAIEGFFANLPGSSQGITILYWLKSFLFGTAGLLEGDLHELVTSPLAPPSEALVRLLVIALGFGLLGGWTVSRKQYVLPS